MFMEILEKECSIHRIPVNTICTCENCEQKYLCDICLNTHDKAHQFLISNSSLNNNIYEKIIENNELMGKETEAEINQMAIDFTNKIEYDFYFFTEYLLNQLTKSKESLLERVNHLKENMMEEAKIWTKLKFDYNKNYLDCISRNNMSICNLNLESEPDDMEVNRNKRNSEYLMDEDFSLDKYEENNQDSNKKKMAFKESLENEAFNSLMRTINSVMEKQLYYSANGPVSSGFNKMVKDGIDEEYSEMKREIIKICEEKIHFANKLPIGNITSHQHYGNRKNSINLGHVNSLSQQMENSPKRNGTNPLNTINSNKMTAVKRSPHAQNNKTKIKTPNLKPESNFLSANSPYAENLRKYTYNSSSGGGNRNQLNHINAGFNSNTIAQNICLDIDPKKFNLEAPQDLFLEKKGSWYTIEYIDELDYIVCGYQTGEILIFKQSDLSPVKTFRPRFKKIRKLIYSPENSSIFASYDDGYIVVIYLTNFKLDHFKMSSSQIYSMELMTNQNILIFGGVEKKILFSHVINLNKVLLFYDSNEGEVQTLLYEENRDVLVSSFRKNTLICFKFSSSDVIFKYEFEGSDCCGMIIKQFREDSFLTCGFFLNLHHFRYIDGENLGVECIGNISLNSLHLYDVHPLSDCLLLLTTYDDGKIIFVDYDNKKIIKSFTGYKGAIMMKIIKNYIYVTSHSDHLKRSLIKF